MLTFISRKSRAYLIFSFSLVLVMVITLGSGGLAVKQPAGSETPDTAKPSSTTPIDTNIPDTFAPEFLPTPLLDESASDDLDVFELLSPSALPDSSDLASCMEQLRYREITTDADPTEDGLWRYPVVLIGPRSEPESQFGPEETPAASMQAAGCEIKQPSLFSRRINWYCTEPRLQVEVMTEPEARSQCQGDSPYNPSPAAFQRRLDLGARAGFNLPTDASSGNTLAPHLCRDRFGRTRPGRQRLGALNQDCEDSLVPDFPDMDEMREQFEQQREMLERLQQNPFEACDRDDDPFQLCGSGDGVGPRR
ncbi:MAG: hypothetical protein F6K30_29660 [Cyanothece sp. SIO2G6]|nr:hypothetical protein [Cyanothece sp. SIO2G6]